MQPLVRLFRGVPYPAGDGLNVGHNEGMGCTAAFFFSQNIFIGLRSNSNLNNRCTQLVGNVKKVRQSSHLGSTMATKQVGMHKLLDFGYALCGNKYNA
jgi:hypothetical protein